MSWLDRFRTPRAKVVPDGRPLDVERAAALAAQGRHREASDILEAAVAGTATDPALIIALGNSRLHVGNPEGARDAFARALQHAPDDFAALRGAGHAELALRSVQIAVRMFEQALTVRPGDVECLRGLGEARLLEGDAAAAERILRGVLLAAPDDARALDLLGLALVHRRDLPAALDAFAAAHAREDASGVDGSAFSNHAITLAEMGRLAEALSEFEGGLAHRPEPFAQYTYGMALLRDGDYARGWDRYEFRWMTDEFIRWWPNFPFPPWTGQDLAGKRLLLVSEQGHGDTLQFVRYASRLRDLGAEVIVVAREELAGLLRTVPGVSHVPLAGDSIPDPDFFVHLMSLPRLLGTTLESVPAEVPYVQASSEASTRWKARLAGAGPSAGIVWAGSPTHARDRHRSVALEALAPLMKKPGVRWFSLQKAVARETDHDHLRAWGVTELGPELASFAETAAIVEALDLVVTVDTSVAHLAGALGKPVWLMLPTFPDFRWMEGRSDSPWYPSMRIFRQRQAGDWSTVVEEMARELDLWPRSSSRSTADQAGGAMRVHEPRPVQTSLVTTAWGTLQHRRDGTDEARSLEQLGEWLPHHLELLQRLVSPDAFVLDMDPGVGTHALALQKFLSAAGHLVLAESRDLQRRMLRYNLRANDLRNHTVLDPAHAGLDSIDELAFGRLDLVRIGPVADIDGIVQRAQATLWRLRPAVVIAASVAGSSQAALRECGYRLWTFDAPLYRADNFARHPRDCFGGKRVTWTFGRPEEAAVNEVAGAIEIT